jgi:hypothetical protein
MKKSLALSVLALATASMQAQDSDFLTKVKTLGAQGAASAASSAANALNKAATGSQSSQTPAGPNADVLQAIDSLKQQVQASMVAFQKSSAPDEVKMKQFDDVLKEFDAVIAETQQGGDLDQLIMKSVTENQKRLSLMRQRANDTSLSEDQRAIYEQKTQSFENQIKQTADKRAILIRQTSQLMAQRDQIQKNKQFYLDMLSVQDLESANKSLDAVNAAQGTLIDALTNLGAKLSTTSSGPAKQ